MSTLSIPVPPELDEFINHMVKSGRAANKADVVRKALRQMSEDEVLENIRRSEREYTEGKFFQGDLKKILKKFK